MKLSRIYEGRKFSEGSADRSLTSLWKGTPEKPARPQRTNRKGQVLPPEPEQAATPPKPPKPLAPPEPPKQKTNLKPLTKPKPRQTRPLVKPKSNNNQ